MYARVLIGIAVTAAVVGCGSSSHRELNGVLVTPTGRVGPLHVDRSTRGDVISFAGKPESESRGWYIRSSPFDALGYGCNGRPAASSVGIPGCKTVFYLDAKTGKLSLLYTSDRRYVDTHGVHVGMSTTEAERRLHELVLVGCDAYLRFETKTGFLVEWFGGGMTPKMSRHLIGGRVGYIVVHSQRLNPGVLDCIDS